jgi:hypothetical protein
MRIGVEELAADAADEALGDRVRARCLNSCLDHLDSGRGEDSVEAVVNLASRSRMRNRNPRPEPSRSIPRRPTMMG